MPSLKGKTVLIIGRAAASTTSYARLLPGPEAVTGIPARCIGTAEDIAAVALMALTNGVPHRGVPPRRRRGAPRLAR